jgi:hypothetical protein
MISIMSDPGRSWQDKRARLSDHDEELTMMHSGPAARCLALVLLSSVPAASQHQHGTAPDPSTSASVTASPYAGLQPRAVKALSEQQIEDLKAGRGMGLALAAELNGYPGPVHVLELADHLQLTPAQRARTGELLEAMQAETIPIGEQILAEEISLDRMFAEKSVRVMSLNAAAMRIGAAQGALRSAHLRYHLAMVDLLTPGQVTLYAERRGYAPSRHNHHKLP